MDEGLMDEGLMDEGLMDESLMDEGLRRRIGNGLCESGHVGLPFRVRFSIYRLLTSAWVRTWSVNVGLINKVSFVTKDRYDPRSSTHSPSQPQPSEPRDATL